MIYTKLIGTGIHYPQGDLDEQDAHTEYKYGTFVILVVRDKSGMTKRIPMVVEFAERGRIKFQDERTLADVIDEKDERHMGLGVVIEHPESVAVDDDGRQGDHGHEHGKPQLDADVGSQAGGQVLSLGNPLVVSGIEPQYGDESEHPHEGQPEPQYAQLLRSHARGDEVEGHESQDTADDVVENYEE